MSGSARVAPLLVALVIGGLAVADRVAGIGLGAYLLVFFAPFATELFVRKRWRNPIWAIDIGVRFTNIPPTLRRHHHPRSATFPSLRDPLDPSRVARPE